MSDLTPVKSARDTVKGAANLMVTGPIGVGKTTQILTLPGRKFAYVFDPNALESLKDNDIDYLPFIPDVTDLDLSVKTLKKDVFDKTSKTRAPQPKTYLAWEEDFEKRVDAGFFDSYDWICFDSFTTFSEIIMDRVLYLNKRLGKQPEQADWAAEMNTFRNVFRVATSFQCNLYCTAHTEIHRDDEVGKTYGQLIITGRNRVRIPMRFSQIYGLEADSDSKGSVYRCNTVSNRWSPFLRTSIKGLQPVEDVTINWAKDVVGQGIGRFVNR